MSDVLPVNERGDFLSLTHNPSPPPELNEFQDQITGDQLGHTAYSKRFVLQTLMDVLKETQGSDADQNSNSPHELQGELEDQLCQLWDMTVDWEVCKFLVENDVCDIFCSAIAITNKPRLMEICIGIFANILCADQGSSSIVGNEDFIKIILEALRCRDVPTLTETYRVMSEVLKKNELWLSSWSASFQEEKAIEDVIFVLATTTNGYLLRRVADFLDAILDLDESRVSDDYCDRLIDSLVEGIGQCLKEPNDQLDTICILFHALHLVLLRPSALEHFEQEADTILKITPQSLRCLLTELHDSVVDVPVLHFSGLSSMFSIIRRLCSTGSKYGLAVSKEAELWKSIAKLMDQLSMTYGRCGDDCGNPSLDEAEKLPFIRRVIDEYKPLLEAITDVRSKDEKNDPIC